MKIEKNPWLRKCDSFDIYEKDGHKYLIAYLPDDKGIHVKNKIRLHPLLENYTLENINGVLRYNLTRKEDDYIMNKLFPIYDGEKINKIKIKQCIILSVDNEKYNKLRNETINILNQFNLPNISTFLGFTEKTVTKSKFYNCIKNTGRKELTCGRLEIFEKFVKESNGNEWLLHFEDDVRPVNIDIKENLNYLYNIPKDAELIRPYIGDNKNCKLSDVKYKESFGGGMNHAFYISTNGCKKVINYAKKYGWKYRSDVDLYLLSKFNKEIPTGFDGWSYDRILDKLVLCDDVQVDSEEEKLVIYHMSHIIFNQTSLPCAQFKI